MGSAIVCKDSRGAYLVAVGNKDELERKKVVYQRLLKPDKLGLVSFDDGDTEKIKDDAEYINSTYGQE